MADTVGEVTGFEGRTGRDRPETRRWEGIRGALPAVYERDKRASWRCRRRRKRSTENRWRRVVWDVRVPSRRSAGRARCWVNGKVRQSCSALIDQVAPERGDDHARAYMSKFPIVRDLMVDRQRMFVGH